MLKSEPVTEKSTNILLMMSGSIACAKASSLISEWAKQGHTVRVACTRSVAAFVGHSSLQGLGAESVFDNVFAEGRAMEHISLGKWADVVVAAPATSNLINKLAAGIADDAVTTLWQAAYGQQKPMVIVPAMNTRMWRYPATQESVGRLRQWGIHVLPVAKGELACGENGEGRMLEPSEIIKNVDRLLAFDRPASDRNKGKPESRSGSKARGKRILITAGGTRERIDSVRYIGNLSTGRTASALSDELTAAGHIVTWLGARDAIRPESVSRIESYYSFEDLQTQLQALLGSEPYDMIIHAAAVSDFSVDRVETVAGGTLQAKSLQGSGKLSSDSDLVLRLKRNPKLLDNLKGWSANPFVQLIGFKLTDTGDQSERLAAVRKQLDNSVVDAVVHNDLSEISETAHSFVLHSHAHKPVECANNGELASSINHFLEGVS